MFLIPVPQTAKRITKLISRFSLTRVLLLTAITGCSIAQAGPGWLRSYPAYVMSGLKESITAPANRIVIGATVLGALAAAQVDDQLTDYAQKNGLIPESLARIGDNYVVGGWAAFSLSGGILVQHILSGNSRSKLWDKFEYAWTSIVVTNYLTNGLKYSVGRERPDQSDKRAFPSGHTSHSFVVAAVSHELFGYRISLPAYAIATVVGLSRINDHKHYLSDVVFGAGLGTIIGRGFGKIYNNRSVSTNVIPTADGRIQLSIRF